MGLRVYWELCGKYGVKRSDKWYVEVPDPVRVSSDERFEVWWDQKVVTPTTLEHNRPDVVVIDLDGRKWIRSDHVSKRLDGWLKRLGIGDVVGGLHMSAIIGTAAILRKVLSTNA